jgi:hypothetical protein
MRHFCRLWMSALLFICAPSVLHGQTVAWDANSESDIAGYRLSYGTQSGTYTTHVDVGKQTQYQPPQGFDWSRPLFFAVRAYNTSGLVSPYSTEVAWIPPAPAKVTALTANTSYPLLSDRPVTWTTTATGGSPIEYRFWLYRKTGWTMVQDYSASNSFTWTPSRNDIGTPYYIQAWARTVGAAVAYESWMGTPTFSVTAPPMEVWADVDFPTPPGNQVTWTARVDSPPATPLEYKFLVNTPSSGVWTVIRDYAQNNRAQWTPPDVGTYAIQALARAVGSTAAYQFSATTPYFDVSRTALSITGLDADASFPVTVGTRVTWTARVKGGMSGPIQYQFWIYSSGSWILAQPYGASNTFSWTPTSADEGDHVVQVWARSNASTAVYESWRSTAWFRVNPAPMNLTTPTLFPVAPGTPVLWTAEPTNPSANLEYQFWVYSASSTTWTMARAYSGVRTFTWTPAIPGGYAVRVWARTVGSSATFEAGRETDLLQVSNSPAQVVSLISSVPLPTTVGTSITWTAGATSGTAGPLQYQFWRRTNGVWLLVQDYSPVNTYTWTPSASDVGAHSVQVWVRSAGSSVSYESYKSAGTFSIN